MKKNPKLLVVALLVFTLILSAAPSVPVEAKTTSKNYYSDVKSGCKYKSQIDWLAKKGAYKSIATKGKKFQPDKVLTRKELGKILTNLYGKRISITIKGPKKQVTQQYMVNMLAKVSKQLGYKVKLSCKKPESKITRAVASKNIITMIKYSSKLSVDSPTEAISSDSTMNACIIDGKLDINEYAYQIGAETLYVQNSDFCMVFDRTWFIQAGSDADHPGMGFITIGRWEVDNPAQWNIATYSYVFKFGEGIDTVEGITIPKEVVKTLPSVVKAMKKSNNPNTPPNIKGVTFNRCRFDDAFKKP